MIMKKIKNIITLLVVALIGLSLAACSKDNLDTNQYKGGVSLNAFGPNPVMRGGQLRFVGSNLDQIASIQIPGVSAITNFDVVKSGVPSEIRVAIPKDGPTVGAVTLKTKDDQTITTKNELTYIEGIDVTGFTASAMPGDVIKIEGDYLNLILSMAFADGVLVSSSDFVAQDRYFIEVQVPEEAQTGKLEFYTADLTIQRTKKEEDELQYQIIRTDEAIEIGTPSVISLKGRNTAEALGNITAKAGETITVTGTYFNVIGDFTVGGVSVSDLKIANDGTSATFTLPAEAPGGDIQIVCKSGIEVPVGTLTTIKPTNCVATPNPVKAGQTLTITGQDLDVVSAVQFEGADAVSGDNIIVATDKIVVNAVPETATEGNFKLVMHNGEAVDVAFTLVKPVATAYNANPASAGSALQITGTNLDLVKSVTFGEATADLEEGAVSPDGTTLTVNIPMEGKSGQPKLNLANGTSVDAPELSISEAVFCYITAMPEYDEDNLPLAGDYLVVPVANADKLTNVYINGIEVQFAYSSKTRNLTISIPENAKASSTLKLVSSNGEIEYAITVKPNTEISTTIWTGSEHIAWSGMGALSWGGYDWSTVKPGMDLVVYYTLDTDYEWWQMRFGNGSWAALPGADFGYNEGNIALEAGSTKFTLTLTEAMIDALVNQGGLVMTGTNYTLLKIVLVEHISLEETIWKGSEHLAWSGMSALSWGGYDWSTVKPGTILTAYYTLDADYEWWQMRFGNGSWAVLPDLDFGFNEGNIALEAGTTSFSVTLTANTIDALVNKGGLVMTGTNYTLTKLTLK